MVDIEIPASSGLHGPGEITIAEGSSLTMSSIVTSSFLATSTSLPSILKYWKRL
jgi:hypothetical protein